MSFDPGRLRHRAVFQRQGLGSDEYAWGNLLSQKSNLRETTGKERVSGGSIESIRTATLRLRGNAALSELTEADRVVVRGAVWRILGIANADDLGFWVDMLLQVDTTAEV